MDEERKPWDQRPDEPAAAYARFLSYRNLGPARNLFRAYESLGGASEGVKTRAPGNWYRELAEYHWTERAQAWDVSNLTEAGRRVAVKFLAVIEALACGALAALGKLEPASWGEVLETIHALGQYVPPDALQRAGADRVPAGDPEPPARLAG